MKKLLAVMLMMFTLPSFAGVSGDVGVYSDYFFRGESQSMGDRAFQGNLNLDYKGLYGNVWVGEVDGIEDANYRYDLTAGYRLDINDKWYVDGGVVQYRYDDKAIDHMEEWFVKGGNNWLELAMWVDMDDRDNNYKEVTLKMPLIKVVDVAVTHGMMADDSNYQKLSVSKVLDNNFMFGLEVLDGARDGEFMDSAAIFMGYRF
tara:strand:+ start:504 stop:1112 length:609 start_codon:yes stop_codon:yes gene_type:complete